MSLLVFLLVGAIAGWLAGLIVRGFGFGLIGNIVVGIIGALVAGYLFPRLGVGMPAGFIGEILERRGRRRDRARDHRLASGGS